MTKSKQFRLAIALAGVVALLGAGSGSVPVPCLFADTVQQPPPPPPGGGPGGPGGLDMRLLDQLSLTDTQKTQINSLLDTLKTASEPYMKEVMQANEAIRTAIEADTFDESTVQAQADIVGQATADLTTLRARTEAAVYQLLTTAQRVQLKELRQQVGPPH